MPVLKDYNGAMHWDILEVDKIPDFECQPDDVWVCSFPRSGSLQLGDCVVKSSTNLMQMDLYHCHTTDRLFGDFNAAKEIQLDVRFPFADIIRPDLYLYGLDFIRDLPRDQPRMIKSHLHYFLLPNQLKQGIGKIVYIARNPKSCAPSHFKLEKYFYKFKGSAENLDVYMENFLANKSYATPWGKHVSQFWEKSKECDNVHVVQFETLVKDRKTAIKSIATFLEKDLTDEQVDAIYEETSLEAMKNNPAVNLAHLESIVGKSDSAFINKGLIDGWKDVLSPEMIKRMDEMIQNTVGHTDLKFI